MTAAIANPQIVKRPELRDEQDGPCDLCAPWLSRPRGTCHRCNDPIGIYENMGGAGFQSPRPHHFHLEPILDVIGRRPVFEELCLDCYREAWHAAYPGEPYPPAPRQLTEPKLPPEIISPVIGTVEFSGAQ